MCLVSSRIALSCLYQISGMVGLEAVDVMDRIESFRLHQGRVSAIWNGTERN